MDEKDIKLMRQRHREWATREWERQGSQESTKSSLPYVGIVPWEVAWKASAATRAAVPDPPTPQKELTREQRAKELLDEKFGRPFGEIMAEADKDAAIWAQGATYTFPVTPTSVAIVDKLDEDWKTYAFKWQTLNTTHEQTFTAGWEAGHDVAVKHFETLGFSASQPTDENQEALEAMVAIMKEDKPTLQMVDECFKIAQGALSEATPVEE